MAQAGRGTHTIAEDNSAELNGQVIRALSHSMEPSLKNATYGWNGKPLSQQADIFRSTLISSTKFCDASEFESLRFFFKSQAESATGQPIDLTFSKVDFRKVENATTAEGLFKLAVYNHITDNNENGNLDAKGKERLSLEY